MGPLAIRRATRRLSRNTAGLLAVFAVAGVLVLHHSDLAMPSMHDAGMGSAAVGMCIAVFTAVGAAVVAVALGVHALGRWRISPLAPTRSMDSSREPPEARARAGPPSLAVLCVLLR